MNVIAARPLLVSAAVLVALFPSPPARGDAAAPRLPWREAGLDARAAAAHLLDRFAYGARPGEVERVAAMGPEHWFAAQLGERPDPALAARLAGFPSLALDVGEMLERYPRPVRVLREAAEAGVLPRDFGRRDDDPEAAGRRAALAPYRADLLAFFRERGWRPQRELLGEAMAAKLLRAVYAEGQLREVLVDFWLNHFNVSTTDADARPYVPAYERDAIRPHVLGRFADLLAATARHPAMLLYLDNARSFADEDAVKTFDADRGRRVGSGRLGAFGGRGGPGAGRARGRDREMERAIAERRPKGLNENYARELLELHTLGVDGGYDQADVVEVARAFTGWSVVPRDAERMEGRLERVERFGARAGFVLEPPFVFRADVHDAGAKTVLGTKLPAGRGIEDGEDVLALLARHPATARHLARKLAVRFVQDDPPPALVERVAAAFARSGGDLRAAVVAIAESPELWAEAVRLAKVKTPLEVVASSLRAVGAEVFDPRGIVAATAELGQPLYAYQAPTGYPDRADAWVNAGALLGRMSWGLRLASGQVPGVEVDLAGLLDGREPESADAALAALLPVLLPARDPGPALLRLQPVVRDPRLAARVAEAAPAGRSVDPGDDWVELDEPGAGFGPAGRRALRPSGPPDTGALAQVVGVILGSPEFQRR